MAYKYDYIKEGASVEWQRKVDEIRQRDNYICQMCGARDKQVQVHHTWYNQKLHYWEYPNEQLITLCKDCHAKETELVRRFKEIRLSLDTNIANSFESMMKKGILLTSVLNVFERMETEIIMSPKNATIYTTSQSDHPHSVSLPVEEKKQRFLQTLQTFESKYDIDYIQTFTDYWLAENNGKLRFEIGENGNAMSTFGITSDYMKIKLENWKSEYDMIVKGRHSALIINEFKRMAKNGGTEMRCRDLDYIYYCDTNHIVNRKFDRWFGKLLFDRGLFAKEHYNYDSFLKKEKFTSLCNPLTSIKEKEDNTFSDFCVLYEAKQAFNAIKEYNRSILSSIDSQITYKTFCDKYGINYGSNLKHDRSIKEMIESMKFPIQIEYCCGTISVGFNHTSNRNFLLKLNEIFGLKLIIRNWFIPEKIKVPYKVLYQMDGTQFDFRDDSFENGTMKSIKLPTEYKEASFYVEKIEEMLTRR